MNSPYHDVEMAKTMALHFAQVHNIKYNVVVMNPDKNGNYSKEEGSTYEIILDSGLGKANIRKVTDTDELAKLKKIPTVKYKGQ